MELEKQVTSLEPSKKLKELGVEQESLFEWVLGGTVSGGSMEKQEEPRIEPRKIRVPSPQSPFSYYSAFTVAELGEMLPKNTEYYLSRNKGDTFTGRGKEYYVVDVFLGFGTPPIHAVETANTEADARAKMLIYLLENNLCDII